LRGANVRVGVIAERAPFASAHASTIAATPGGLVCAFFAGSREGAPDVGIWLARSRDGDQWGEATLVATGADAEGRPLPCWNPVLHQLAGGPLLLFWRVGPTPRRWWSLMARSSDGGTTWSDPAPLPPGCLGPIRSKPLPVPDGRLLCPSSTEHLGWRCHMELFEPATGTWEPRRPLNAAWELMAIQPTLLDHGNGHVQALCRTRNGVIASTRSRDGGLTWQPLHRTGLPNPNSGIEALTLRDGRHLLVYNPARRRRSPLVLAISPDGERWRTLQVLDEGPGEYSYPAAIEDDAGCVHITWTWQRTRIRHARIECRALG
jgi:predicted neuraminidase